MADSDSLAILGGSPLFADGPPEWPLADDEVAMTLARMAEDGSWGRYFGPHCDRLIDRLKEMHDCDHVILCSSGRAAIELALHGLHVASGHEVAMAAYDFHSNFACIQQVGATPVLLDIRADDAQMDVDQVEVALSSQTTAIIASHLHGGIVDMPRLRDIADKRETGLIEDACQASGATVDGRPAGMWGDIGVLSFGGSKLLTAGRGGALLTNRADVVQRIRRHLRGDNHACPLSEMQAAVLLPQLGQLAERHRQRSEAVGRLRDALKQTSGLRLFNCDHPSSSAAYYKVGMFYDADAFDGLMRDDLVSALKAEGLAIDAGFTPLHTTHSRRRFRPSGDLETSTKAGQTIVSLHHPILLDDSADWQRLYSAVERIRSHSSEVMSGTLTGR